MELLFCLGLPSGPSSSSVYFQNQPQRSSKPNDVKMTVMGRTGTQAGSPQTYSSGFFRHVFINCAWTWEKEQKIYSLL